MIEVIRPGQYTTIQDLGRFGYRSMGVPVSGPMDSVSSAHANEILGNHPNDPLIEMAYVGATFLFHQSATIAISGASCEMNLNGQNLEERSIFTIEAGSTLAFGAMKNGNFLYLAIRGGFISPISLGSACYFGPITGVPRMQKWEKLFFDSTRQQIGKNQEAIAFTESNQSIEVEKGPEFHLLSKSEISVLTNTSFTISPQSNRMGYRLNEYVGIRLKEIISSPVQPGTIQLTTGGQLIVLMRDAQTIGGYPRVLQLTDRSIDQLSQIVIGKMISFELINHSITNRESS